MKKLVFLPLYYSITALLLPFVVSLFVPSLPVEKEETESTITVYNHITGASYTQSENEYLTGVVAAEMPALFEKEALKAQAVAARTYAMYTHSDTHTEDVCTDPGHCQAYYTKEDMALAWGNDFNFYLDKISSAVKETENELITYNSEPIMAVFHSMGGGKTENSLDVWGNAVPYLVSVESPGEDEAANYFSEKIIPFESFKETFLSHFPNASLTSFQDISHPLLTDGGHVKSMIIGGVSVSGTKMRSMYDLRSTKFTLSEKEGNIVFSVTGYGHGVGMSQYGANAMAKQGKTYKEILSHYYPGTSLTE